MWFKNIQVFRFTEDVNFEEGEWNDLFSNLAFSPLQSHQPHAIGFSPPIKSLTEQYIYIINGYAIFCIKEQEKIIPSSVVNEKLEEKVESIQVNEHRKVTRKERSDLRDDIIHELTPRAFSKTQRHYAYISIKDNLLVINSSSIKKADLIIDNLRNALGRAPLIPLTPKMAPIQSMTQWLQTERLPLGFTFGDSLVLKDLSDQGGTIRCKQQDLLSEEITAHLKSGLQVTELSITWKDRISFSLNEKLIIKSIKFSDLVTEELDHSFNDDEVSEFNQNFTLMTLEFSQFITDFISALGGENQQAKEKLLEAALLNA